MSQKGKSQRSHDVFYDPSFIVGSQKDYERNVFKAKMINTKYAVCPIYPSMFSELRHYPRKEYVIRNTFVPAVSNKDPSQPNIATNLLHNDKSKILGSERHKFFTSSSNLEVKIETSTLKEHPTVLFKEKVIRRRKMKNKTNQSVQTAYRDSSAQTQIWEPNYKVIQGNPELLKLDFLNWAIFQEPGETVVRLIKQARQRNVFLQNLHDKTEDLQAMFQFEKDHWLKREKEIEEIQNLRLELLEKMLNELLVASDTRNKRRMREFTKLKLKERDSKLNSINRIYKREMRRLESNHKGFGMKYSTPNIVEEHSNYNSEMYLPLIRHGSNPKYGHQVITNSFNKYKPQFYKVENYKTNPNWLKQATNLKELKLPGTRLCIRETKWTESVLKRLHEELKTLGEPKNHKITLRERIRRDVSEVEVQSVPCKDFDGILHELSVFLQKILRGRASQLKIFKGRETYRELINELRSNFMLMKHEEGNIKKWKALVDVEQKKALQFNQNMKLLESSLRRVSGNVVGTLLDFLNKEQTRLIDERKAHALVMLLEREKIKREAEESGKRQKEIRRRAEHDEIFKQVIKVQQETVDVYLQDIITEGIEFNSKEEAENYVLNLLKKIQDDQHEISFDADFKHDFIANQLNHFVIPEVQKQIIREKQRAIQKNHLKIAHAEIYNTMETQVSSTKIKKGKLKISVGKNADGGDTNIDEVLMNEIKERDFIAKDIRDMLYRLVDEPYKKEVLDRAGPCYPDFPDIVGEDFDG